MSTMGDTKMATVTATAAPFSSPRPTPHFYNQEQTFSTKKERKSTSTPTECPPPRPPTPVKSCPPISRMFPWKNILSNHAQVVSFKNADNSSLSPIYNENSNDSYFEQMFEDPEPIGCGSFGEVFKVKSREDGKHYAIKKSKDRFKGQYDRKRKMEEVAKHETLPSHSNCVQFVKAWEERGHLYIQTELCKMSVSQFCEENHSIPESVIWNYMVDLLMAVKHLHDRNLVHMDIKPDNAFISFDDICKMGDFGLVIDLTKQRELSEAMEGDPKYLAPELMDGIFGRHADIFSLGMFFLELACDLDLPRGGNGWHILRSGKIPDNLLSGRSFDLRNVLTQMLEPNHKKRPTVDQCLAFPCIKSLLKSRMKRFMFRGAIRRLRSNTPSPPTSRSTPSKPGSGLLSQTALLKANSDGKYRNAPYPELNKRVPSSRAYCVEQERKNMEEDREDDCERLMGTRGVNPDLNCSDEFVLPRNPPPRRAFTTPAVRRRPASFVKASSPIKRLLFEGDLSNTGSSSSPVSSRLSPAASCGSPVLSPASSVASDLTDRPGTPPSSTPIQMDCDHYGTHIEPKNLLGMFENASDDDDEM